MHLAEPRLYWRIKTAKGWRYVPAIVERNPFGRICGVRYPEVPFAVRYPEVDESD